ncbi:Aspartate/glutamate/uridylate kinase [Macleaya cordata]|uniref:Aspartate/glutamate/uridylate kinase n=1 Tax=Macleaya cordata TaxID=56857 RepID=A0A200QIK5_MACCD|nr:Aspartate/glutamate/uridylate kinase [Macleaya cordata]
MAFSSSFSPSRSVSSNASAAHIISKHESFLSPRHFFLSSNFSSAGSFLHRSYISRISYASNRRRRDSNHSRVFASVADVSLDKSIEKIQLPKGDKWSVHKFGGTCVGTSERIQNVADVIVSDDSERKLIVVSAMSKVTDMMYNLIYKAQSRDESYISALDDVLEKHRQTAHELLDGDDLASFLSKLHHDINNLKALLRAIYIAGHATESFSDFVVGHGELWSAHMLSSVVRKLGVDCNWMDTREVIIVNLTSANQVDPDFSESEKRLEEWYSKNPSKTIIATGFIASTPQNIPTTLKRDGSDFSAAIMGALLRARRVTIWTDVDGVYSADPRKVSEAVILSSLSYQEAWEMSYFGANVLHPRTIIPVMRYDIPIIIRNIFNLSAPGTMICRPPANENGDGQMLESVVKGFATIDNLALVNVEGTGMAGVPGTASAIFGAVKDVGANVIMISQASSEHSVCFAVPEKEVNAVAEALQSRFREALGAGRLSQVEVIPNCSILAAVGQKMASTPGVSASLFNALAKANINVRAIAQGCSEYNVTVVLKREDCIRALRAVHSRFYLSKTTIAMGIIGPGLIGGTLLDQLRDQAAVLKEEFNIDLRVMGIAGSRTMVLNELGMDLSRWRELLSERGEVADLEKFAQHVHGNHFIPNTVLVDCTADTEIASKYYDWLRKGIHVITPNKKANSGPLDQYLKLRALQRQSYTHYFYEATVGAGLPIVSTLRGLLETGDKILRIEGIFSGTLSYIFNNFIGKRAFSEVVAEAKQAGYTEPDPRDDLSGTDVGRKIIILARESGLKLELSDIPVQSLVPEPLRICSSVEEFMKQLPKFDQDMTKKQQDAEAAGEVLRYVGVVDAVNGRGTVELRTYKKDHPFAQLSGSDNIIAFTTTRYKEQPLIVRGPGAGAQVTAGGIFSDILRLASSKVEELSESEGGSCQAYNKFLPSKPQSIDIRRFPEIPCSGSV